MIVGDANIGGDHLGSCEGKRQVGKSFNKKQLRVQRAKMMNLIVHLSPFAGFPDDKKVTG